MANATTADAINHAVDKIGDGIAQITAAISSHAPQAWELVVRGNYARAAATEVTGVGLTIASVAMAAVAWKLVDKGLIVHRARTDKWSDAGFGQIIAGILVAVFASGALLGGLLNLLDPPTIAMLIEPNGTTARELLLHAL